MNEIHINVILLKQLKEKNILKIILIRFHIYIYAYLFVQQQIN